MGNSFLSNDSSNSTFQIGDMLMTYRNNLNSDWLPCNGQIISSSDYSLLTDKIGIGRSLLEQYPSSNLKMYSFLKYVNGYWIALYQGTFSSSGSSYTTTGLTLLYTTNPSSSSNWTKKEITSSDSFTVYDIAYGNGYYQILTEKKFDDDCYIYYASSLNGTWTGYRLTDVGANEKMYNIIYANGYWAFATSNSSNGYIYIYYQSSPGSSWNYKSINKDDELMKCNVPILYSNGNWIIAYTYDDPSWTTGLRYHRIAYCSTLTGTWTEKNIYSSHAYMVATDDSYNLTKNLKYLNGYYIVVGNNVQDRFTGTGETTYRPIILYNKSLTSNYWTAVVPSDRFEGSINDIFYVNQTWFISGDFKDNNLRRSYSTLYSNSLDNLEWNTCPSWSEEGIHFYDHNNNFILFGDGENLYTTNGIQFYLPKLPNTYIKAK